MFLSLIIITDVVEQKLLQQYRITDCVVLLDRLEDEIAKPIRKRKFLLAPEISTERSNKCWISTPASTVDNSVEALTAFAEYQDRNGIVLPKKRRLNVRRERAKSMYVERPLQFNNAGRKKMTMDDMHSEFSEKYNRPNRGLKPGSDRQLPEPQPRPIPECQKILNELKTKLAAKTAKNST